MSDSRPGDPGPLRTAAFLCTVFAALATGVGALLTWATFGLRERAAAVLDEVYKGVDLTEGKVALGCAIALLLGVLAFRRMARPGRTAVAVVMIAAGVVAMGAAGATALTANTRLETVFVDDVLTSTAGARLGVSPTDADRQRLNDLVETSLGAGVWITLAGGFLGFLGGTLSLAYATRRDDVGEPLVLDDPTPAG